MNEKRILRALVVDDEAAMQKLLVRGLTQQGFKCDTAADGNEAEERVSCSHYDAVVTDLRMPNKHGHALAVHLLAREHRPVVVVHTGVIEPKLAKDLLARGVDDILFKPFDFGILAAKVKALVERRSPGAPTNHGTKETDAKTANLQNHRQEDATVRGPVTLSNLESKLSRLSHVLPISTAALDVYTMTSDDQTTALQLAAAIQREAAFAAQMLRLANSAFITRRVSRSCNSIEPLCSLVIPASVNWPWG